MLIKEKNQIILDKIIELLELPESAYNKATKRYEDLGDWFDRDESLLKDNNPHIFPQGSFMLGTAIRPLAENEEYDLDLVCKLRDGITKDSHTQESLKKLIGQELEFYRKARGIKEELISKHRCWCLEYQDELCFHIDIVPCIPEDEKKRSLILESMRKSGTEEFVASFASQTTVSITDDRHEGYKHICSDWNISNPEGYAKWFEHRMNLNQMSILLEKAQVDELPLFKRKTPLQRCIQLLKRHRDQMFGKNESKPISIIITTLAAKAYNGEKDVESALRNILSQMGELVNPSAPRVPNPVDPDEDFADKWAMPKYRHLNLEQNFYNWIQQAQSDIHHITSTTDIAFITEQAQQKFSLKINDVLLAKRIGVNLATVSVVTPKVHSISEPAKPWQKD
ncbi:MAG: nucleotidyltransferase [Clostridia bacterium]|nr:nucleotidyltransferase [Clostridia bacterium]